MCEFLRIDPVIFVFPAVDEFEVQCVGKNELDISLEAGIRQPVPIESAFTHNGQVMPVGFHTLEEIEEPMPLQ